MQKRFNPSFKRTSRSAPLNAASGGFLMRPGKMRHQLRNIAALIVLVGGFLLPDVSVADVCTHDAIGINWLAGTVVMTNDRRERPLADATIELFARGDLTQAVARALTTDKGAFTFAAREDGNYVIRVSRESYAPYTFPVRLQRLGTMPRTLKIHLAVGGAKPCVGSWAKVVLNAV